MRRRNWDDWAELRELQWQSFMLGCALARQNGYWPREAIREAAVLMRREKPWPEHWIESAEEYQRERMGRERR